MDFGGYIDQSERITALEAALNSSMQLGPFLRTELPSAAANMDRYAIVTDLFGEKRDIVRASSAGSMSFWQPVRPIYAKTYDVAGANFTVGGLSHASIINLGGNVAAGITRNVTVDLTQCWPGYTLEIAFDGVLGLGAGLNILGTGIGTLVMNLLGNRKRLYTELVSGALTLRAF